MTQNLTPECSIIIISYNTREMTLACLASVFDQTVMPCEVIVVDNASSDGSAEAIAEQFPQVRLVAESINHGFAPAHDVAVPLCTAPFILLLNPDTVVLDGALDKLMAFAKRTPDAGIWGGRTVAGDGSLDPTSCWQRMTLWSTFCRTAGFSTAFRSSELFNSEEMGTWPRNSEREVDIITGCLLLIRRETWDALDGFDPAFIMYGEEVDLCLRARDLGVRPRFTPDVTIIHYGGASDTVVPDKMVRLMRAKIELVKRHFPSSTRWLGYHLLRLWPWSRAWAFSAIGKLRGSDSARARAAEWHKIWQRRAEWSGGYSDT